ncbi:beta-klotho [Alosa sapidissima]|uniref:beta-klotho n=1 Tax=Alosa sapidissima TaxID=34773 RepID=UPI001C09118C|nr:beta-klotho [Alosa sapidissima]
MTTAQDLVLVAKVSLLLFSFLSVCFWDQALCSPGEGLKQWQKSPTITSHQNKSLYLHTPFPSNFLWGVGTSAYQTEGSWDQGGKGPSIWDHFTHTRGASTGTADTAADSYTRWEEDVKAVKYLGTQTYVFSLSWPRLFPNGVGDPNSEGVAHYQRLISRLQAEGITPVVTLYHWDLPLALQEPYGGWKNDSTVEAFVEYATFCFRTFGGSVKYWLTMHNPYLIAVQGYGTGVHAPGESHDPAATFIVGHNLIRAHAKVWHVYNTHFRPHQNGQVSLTLGSHWIEPFNGESTPASVQLCQKSMEAVIGWFAGPIHGTGDYPASLKDSNRGLIPEFSPEETAFVQGTADFLSLAFGPDTLRMGQRLPLFGQVLSMDLRKVLGWIRLEYDNPAVLVAESDWFTDASVRWEDTLAIYVMRRLLGQVLEAVTYDNAQVFGYTAWSLVDGFEWNFGYTVRRGLFYVDLNGTDLSRVPKTSAKFYRQVVLNNGFSDSESSESIHGEFPCDFQWGVADPVLHIRLHPYSAQFIDPNLYRWNFSGDGSLRPVSGVTLRTRGAQCTDFLSIRRHLQLLETTHVTHYRFALDWSLLLPDGDPSHVDQEALRYYRCFLIELHKLGVKAVVTLYHSSHRSPTLGMPKPLQATGGWLNRSTVEAFEAYATFCFQELSPWVHTWITINEPNRLAELHGSVEEQRRTAHHLLLAHAHVWHVYNDLYRPQHGAQVTFTLHADWVEPANPFLESHQATARRFLLYEVGRFLDPFLAEGGGQHPDEVRGYAEDMVQTPGQAGLSPLPHFTDEEQQKLRGALDFIALNHFTTRLVSPRNSLHRNAQAGSNQHHGCSFFNDPNWHVSYLGQAVVPWGLRKVLKWVKGRYGDARPIVVMASGVDDQASHDDQLRQTYIREYLQEALKARELDGVDLRGLYIWNLQDRRTFHFGLFAPTHYESHPKGSVTTYQEIISHRGFPSGDGGTQESCQQPPPARAYSCSVCTKMSENKPLLFFGLCMLVSAAILSGVLVGTLRRKLSMGRRCAARPMSPQRVTKQHWERFAMQRVVRRL